MGLFNGTRRWADDESWIKRHSLSLALITLLTLQAIVVIATGYPEWLSDQQMHKQPVMMIDFFLWFVYEMTVSIIADTYGALLLVLFAKWFYEEGSPESNENPKGKE